MEPAGPAFRVEPLETARHDRAAFSCCIDSLDQYLKSQASQDMRRKANAVFVLVHAERPSEIIGYATLCAYALAPGEVPESARRHIPRYPRVSATLIGRLAIARAHQGKGMGSLLLARALRKAWENAAVVGSSMVVVDAIDERAATFYAAHGFVRLPDSPRLILPMHTLGRMLAG